MATDMEWRDVHRMEARASAAATALADVVGLADQLGLGRWGAVAELRQASLEVVASMAALRHAVHAQAVETERRRSEVPA